ncbi:vesicular integral-membrane protein VIP36 [Zootermopsis nevadensis]|uniref:Vesicular integral-membrane protein VIP36 n=1 Tax=Zootermopsis nevadensis TaxID=136037 RepID=A0A067R7B1_ZOONE|nr:vesicular integral-membrane protein VIP36 [Zootermopsis nevadensis]KDR14191.1 Vesicular integral-membrane protein VIP36 [Zootermopsis nevadensis]
MTVHSVTNLLLSMLVLFFMQIKAEWNTKDYMKREHSLIKPYQGAGMTIPYWDFMGSTIVTNNYVRLTPDSQSKQGLLWNSVPCNARNWQLQVHFKVHGKGKELYGDGFAIWYAKDRMVPGLVFGNMDYFQGLAVILDTYSNHNGPHNHQHPYVSAMVNNGSLHYDHDRDGTHTQLAGCEAKFRNLDHDSHISIRYERDVLTVSTDIENKAAWKECLSVHGVRLPTGYYFGITAATGDLSDIHDIMSVRLFELDLPDDPKEEEDRSQISPSAAFFESPRDHVDDPKPSSLSGIKIFLLMLVGALAVIACVVIGIMFYQKHQENSRKRFY